SSRRRHTISKRDWSSDVCSSDLNTIISLDIDSGETVDVMVHDYQKDPLKGDVTHLDFYVVNMSEEMDVEVVLHLEGEPQGVKEGGILQQPIYELQVRAKPRDI